MSVKIIASLLTIFCVAINGFGQIPLGFKVGVNINQMELRGAPSALSTEGFATKTSFHAGIFTKIELSPKFNLIPELQYIDKKSSYELRYIELPLLLSYSPLSWVSIEAGGSFGFNVHRSVGIFAFDDPDGGVLGGLRFSYRQWSLLARYYYGLTSIEDIYLSIGPGMTTHNKNTQFSIAYCLKNNKKK